MQLKKVKIKLTRAAFELLGFSIGMTLGKREELAEAEGYYRKIEMTWERVVKRREQQTLLISISIGFPGKSAVNSGTNGINGIEHHQHFVLCPESENNRIISDILTMKNQQ